MVGSTTIGLSSILGSSAADDCVLVSFIRGHFEQMILPVSKDLCHSSLNLLEGPQQPSLPSQYYQEYQKVALVQQLPCHLSSHCTALKEVDLPSRLHRDSTQIFHPQIAKDDNFEDLEAIADSVSDWIHFYWMVVITSREECQMPVYPRQKYIF